MDLNSILTNNIFPDIDKIVNKLYTKLNDIDKMPYISIEWKKSTDEIKHLIKSSDFNEELKNVILSATIIDLHVRYCEKRNIDVNEFARNVSYENFLLLIDSLKVAPFK